MRLSTISVITALIQCGASGDAQELVLRYDEPADAWTEALPIGNGRLGAMVFGGVAEERLQLNEDTLWSGGPSDWNNPQAAKALPEVREALFAGDYEKANKLSQRMQGPYTQSYQPLADVKVRFDRASAEARGYERTLDLREAIAETRYRQGRATIARTYFSSYADQVIVARFESDAEEGLSFTLTAQSQQRYAVETMEGAILALRGEAPSHVDPSYLQSDDPIRYEASDPGMTFEMRVKVLSEGGRIERGGSELRVVGARAATLIIAAATSFANEDLQPQVRGKDPSKAVARRLGAAILRGYEQLRKRHVADYQQLFERVSLDLGSRKEGRRLTTDERLVRFQQGAEDPELATLLYQYGRYLLIASSRPGTQPANLQGIWNDSMRPPWSSNWTLNINAQMNYWPAEVANLAECHEPFLSFIELLAKNGAETARVNYGAAGWVAHHNSDIWGQTAPVGNYGEGDPMWANWQMSAAWLSQHFWERYAFGQDEGFLRERAWPVMKGAAEFCLDWLVEDDQGRLVTAPGTSPEIDFHTPQGGRASVAVAPTMDMAIIWDLFANCIQAAEILEIEDGFVQQLREAQARLLPPRIGSRGQLQEWAEDFEETDRHHRHVSHLFGVHPGRQITPDTPELFEAARRSLEIRGDEGTGWSLGWKINFWARFRDGDRAYKQIRNLLRPVGEKFEGSSGGGGVYANLFDAHPPFQIDGNFGYVAGVSEMLAQSHRGFIDLLPALPSAWPKGEVRGLRARGGVELDLSWRKGELAEVVARPVASGEVELRYGDRVARLELEAGEEAILDGALRLKKRRSSD